MNKIYDCNLCMHKEVCDLWSKHECQNASSFQLDGCNYYKDKSRYICVDDIKGPGPDPKGLEGTKGSATTKSPTCQPPDWTKFQMKRMILEEMEYMRRDLYMQEEQLNVLRVKLYKHLKEANQCEDASGRGND